MKFIRHDLMDHSEDMLTIVASSVPYYSTWLKRESPYIVLVTQGAHVVGLYDLDGDAITVAPRGRWQPSFIPKEVIAAVEEGWESGNYTVERQ